MRRDPRTTRGSDDARTHPPGLRRRAVSSSLCVRCDACCLLAGLRGRRAGVMCRPQQSPQEGDEEKEDEGEGKMCTRQPGGGNDKGQLARQGACDPFKTSEKEGRTHGQNHPDRPLYSGKHSQRHRDPLTHTHLGTVRQDPLKKH